MNELSISTEQLLQIIGTKEVEIILCKLRIAELSAELSKQKEEVKE